METMLLHYFKTINLGILNQNTYTILNIEKYRTKVITTNMWRMYLLLKILWCACRNEDSQYFLK